MEIRLSRLGRGIRGKGLGNCEEEGTIFRKYIIE